MKSPDGMFVGRRAIDRKLLQSLERVRGIGARDFFLIIKGLVTKLFRPLHLIIGGLQDLPGPGILRIGVKSAAEKKHELDKKANGTPIRKSITARPGHRPAEGHP